MSTLQCSLELKHQQYLDKNSAGYCGIGAAGVKLGDQFGTNRGPLARRASCRLPRTSDGDRPIGEFRFKGYLGLIRVRRGMYGLDGSGMISNRETAVAHSSECAPRSAAMVRTARAHAAHRAPSEADVDTPLWLKDMGSQYRSPRHLARLPISPETRAKLVAS